MIESGVDFTLEIKYIKAKTKNRRFIIAINHKMGYTIQIMITIACFWQENIEKGVERHGFNNS